MPPDVLCHILHYYCDGNLYTLDLLRPLSRNFRASVAMVRACPCISETVSLKASPQLMIAVQTCATLAIADMREIFVPGLNKSTLGTATMIKVHIYIESCVLQSMTPEPSPFQVL